jgi:hypothetical protein
LTPPVWRGIAREGLEQSSLLRLGAPPTEEEIAAGQPVEVEDVNEQAVEYLAQGGHCNAPLWIRRWHATARGTRYERETARHDFIGRYTEGRYDSLPRYLHDATDEEANALLVALIDATTPTEPQPVVVDQGTPQPADEDMVALYDRLHAEDDEEHLPPNPTAVLASEDVPEDEDVDDGGGEEEPAPNLELDALIEDARALVSAHAGQQTPADKRTLRAVADALLPVVEGDTEAALAVIEMLLGGRPLALKHLTQAEAEVLATLDYPWIVRAMTGEAA